MIQYRSYKNLTLPYSASHIPNNFSVVCKDGDNFDFSIIHKYGVITGNQELIADSLKKPWPTSSSVPTGALALSLVIFQTKSFLFDEKPVLVVLSSRGPFVCFTSFFLSSRNNNNLNILYSKDVQLFFQNFKLSLF